MGLEKTAIEVSGLSVTYLEYRQTLSRPWGNPKYVKALDNVSLSVETGRTTALIGRNGSGKTTLLNTMTGLIRPSDGCVTTQGRVILLSGTNPGFVPSITGRENLIELGLAYGVGKNGISDFCESVEDFADIGEAIDRNFSGYSTGMRGKLGFGFITALDPEILLIDETLGVGDVVFREKAQRRLRTFIERSGTVIISTHSFNLAKEICEDGIFLDKGQLIHHGSVEDSVRSYVDMTRDVSNQ